ncbi:MAG: response regulator [Desulfatibacillaceae bacterium]
MKHSGKRSLTILMAATMTVIIAAVVFAVALRSHLADLERGARTDAGTSPADTAAARLAALAGMAASASADLAEANTLRKQGETLTRLEELARDTALPVREMERYSGDRESLARARQAHLALSTNLAGLQDAMDRGRAARLEWERSLSGARQGLETLEALSAAFRERVADAAAETGETWSWRGTSTLNDLYGGNLKRVVALQKLALAANRAVARFSGEGALAAPEELASCESLVEDAYGRRGGQDVPPEAQTLYQACDKAVGAARSLSGGAADQAGKDRLVRAARELDALASSLIRTETGAMRDAFVNARAAIQQSARKAAEEASSAWSMALSVTTSTAGMTISATRCMHAPDSDSVARAAREYDRALAGLETVADGFPDSRLAGEDPELASRLVTALDSAQNCLGARPCLFDARQRLLAASQTAAGMAANVRASATALAEQAALMTAPAGSGAPGHDGNGASGTLLYAASTIFAILLAAYLVLAFFILARAGARDRLARTESGAHARARRAFLAGLAEEIREPARAAAREAARLLDRDLDIDGIEIANAIHSHAVLANLLAEGYRDYARLQEGELDVIATDFDPRQVAGQLIEDLSPLSNAKNVRMVRDFDESVPPTLHGDSNLLRMLLAFAADEVLRLVSDCPVRLRARVESESGPTMAVRFSFVPQNPSLAVKRPAAKTPRPGAEILREIARGLSGDSGMDSVDNAPAPWFILPLGRGRSGAAPAHPAFSPRPQPVEEKPVARVPEGRAMVRKVVTGDSVSGGINVLVVAADASVRDTVEQALEQSGLSPDIALNHEDALFALETGPYDLIFLETALPERNGFEITRLLRDPASRVVSHDCVVVGVGADRDKCMAEGMNEHLPSPPSRHDVRTLVARLVPGTG